MTTTKPNVKVAKAALQALPSRHTVKLWVMKYPGIVKEIQDARASTTTAAALVKVVIEIVRRHTKKLYRNPFNYVNLMYCSIGDAVFHARFEGNSAFELTEKALAKLRAKA